ncbi:Exo-beta-D-glucosaminidase [Kordia antarctica]|uniref:Beta-mannosidase B n=1 Tax=Kordia antarctica TaxID=1218801 RepID=A0A7L4ZD22_9FLAO|nr:glycoside hydrolase family 2 protein [Kordia antarctica]QHI34768.1 Exo-beta-D-glucosaminidase [Kordia antarctica]
MNKFFTFLLILSIVSCVKDKSKQVSEIHQNWKFKQQTDTVWNSATVPGNVFSDLLHHEKIKNPFVGTNELNVQWVSGQDWNYQTTFELDSKTLNKSNIELTFEGLDTYATIYLNNSVLGKTDNAFRTWNYDIKKLAKAQNKLRIVFNKTSTHEEKEASKLAYALPESPRVFTRKAQFQYGWDWGPKLNTTGIWKPVTLKAWDDVLLEDIYIKQDSLVNDVAYLTFEYTITADTEKEIKFEIDTNDRYFMRKMFIPKKGTHTYKLSTTIERPELWWTHNLGTPYLYTFDFTLKQGETVKATRTVKKGIRTIELVTEKDAKGETFYFKLNGVPVFMKGSNYIPQHSFQEKVTDAHYEKILNDVVDANMNMLRVWGGGIYENDIFYELCDEKGILIWQDFMFACAMYPGDESFLENVQQEAIDQVTRLRKYASIALWCGNNENSEGWKRWGWKDDKTETQKEDIWKGYLKVFDSILPKTIAKLNPEVSYWESSPKYGRGNPKYEFEGDAHDWWVWHDAYPFEHFEEKVPRFMSEFGFQSFPSYETIRYFTEQDSIDLNHDSYVTHQKHARGFQLIREYMERDFKVPENGDDYVYVSQLLQARGITKGMEAQRRAMPYCMGSLYWQLNDCWPVVSWSSIDFMGNWKALHYKAKESFKDMLVSSVIENDTLKTYIVSDKLKVQEGELKLTFLDFNGNILHKINQTVTIKANTSQLMVQLPITDLKFNHKQTVLKAVLDYAKVSKYSSSDTRFDSSTIPYKATSLFYLVKPKDLALPAHEIDTFITARPQGFAIDVTSKTLQKNVFLHTKVNGHFSDNFFDLLPNETKTIIFHTEAENIDDLAIKTLNSIHTNSEKNPS